MTLSATGELYSNFVMWRMLYIIGQRYLSGKGGFDRVLNKRVVDGTVNLRDLPLNSLQERVNTAGKDLVDVRKIECGTKPSGQAIRLAVVIGSGLVSDRV